MGIIVLVTALFFWNELYIELDSRLSKTVINVARVFTVLVVVTMAVLAFLAKGTGTYALTDTFEFQDIVMNFLKVYSLAVASVVLWFSILFARCMAALANGSAPGVSGRVPAIGKLFFIVAFGSFCLPLAVPTVIIAFIVFWILKKILPARRMAA